MGYFGATVGNFGRDKKGYCYYRLRSASYTVVIAAAAAKAAAAKAAAAKAAAAAAEAAVVV